MGRITVFSGGERRRRWGDDEKLAMVEASLAPGMSRSARQRSGPLATWVHAAQKSPTVVIVDPGHFAPIMYPSGDGHLFGVRLT